MIDKGGILVIDDFIDKDYQEDIKDILLGKTEWGDLLFPWHYIDDVSCVDDINFYRVSCCIFAFWCCCPFWIHPFRRCARASAYC